MFGSGQLHVHEPYTVGHHSARGRKPSLVSASHSQSFSFGFWMFLPKGFAAFTKGRDSNMFIVLKGEAWQLRMTP